MVAPEGLICSLADMKKLDWYILKKFLTTFVFTMLTFTVIAVVIDTSEKADDFVKSGLTTWQLVTHYFIGFIPFIMSMIFGCGRASFSRRCTLSRVRFGSS